MLPNLLLAINTLCAIVFCELILTDTNPKGLIGLGVLIVFNAITAIAMML